MSMPTKGKHHHPNHHHQQSHNSHIQTQHIIGLNISQATVPSVSHTAHAQHYNPAVLNNTSRFVSHPGSDFHVPGQNFGAQATGQVGGSANSIAVQGGRNPSLGTIQPIGQASSGVTPGISSSGQSQTSSGPNIQPQSAPNSSVSTAMVHNQPSQDMSKQTHLQTQPVSMQQVYVQNSNRSSTQQNYYSSGSRPQQPRNLAHRTAPSSNQTQVVGMPSVGSTSGQPTSMYPHPNIAMQPSAMYVQNQVSGIHTNPHQQNVYSINNQMSIPYTGQPQRHQTHHNQFPYQSYQSQLLATSNLFGYTHGTQHPGFFFHQPANTQLNLNRTGANSVSSGNQHISGSLASNTAQGIVSQGALQQSTQQTQSMHALSVPLPQTDVFSGFNGGLSNAGSRSKKPRTKAITDIVNPNTGKNISDEIYKDESTITIGQSINKESPQSLNCNVELVADFAARVAILASESQVSTTLEKDNSSVNLQLAESTPSCVQKLSSDCIKNHQCDKETEKLVESSTTNIPEEEQTFSSELQNLHGTNSDTEDIVEEDLTKKTSTAENTLITQNNSTKVNSGSPEIKNKTESGNLLDIAASVNKNVEHQPDDCFIDDNIEKESIDANISSETISTSSKHQYNDVTSQRTNGGMGTKYLELDTRKNDSQKCADGKTMQKQKNKNKVKSREIMNRKSIEKDISDMDTMVNCMQIGTSTVKIESKEDAMRPKESIAESTKEVKDKDNYEFRKEKDITELHYGQIQKCDLNLDEKIEKVTISETDVIEKKNNKEVDLEETHGTLMTKDVVDHIAVLKAKTDKELVQSIVAQKNEENSIVSGLCIDAKEDEICTSATNLITSATKTAPLLKYTYSDDQWSPLNTSGKKVYGREFLMKLQSDPNSRIKPSNLPDLDVVLKDNTKTRSSVDLRFKDTNLGRHDSLFPGFVKSSLSAKVPPSNKKSHSGKPKTGKPNVIHVSLSLREDVKLRETENAWKPTRLVQGSLSEEQSKTEALYKKVRSVLNKLTPQKFDTLVKQVRGLKIDTQERLQGVIDLVFEKAVDEPNFSVAYAIMCKELSNMEVTGADAGDSSSANFRKLIVTRCQTEFEKNTVDENARNEKLREIDECTDPEKKKELQMIFEEEERRIRVKSVGNIRFIGELFKQNMLTCKIMHQCIRHLLTQIDEENLECLCKLLTTIGKALEDKQIDLSDHFKQMQQIANQKGKVSSRIRFMLQDVIDLKMNKWIPRRDDSNPKTMDQIQKEAESERMDNQLINSSLNTPRKDERTNERKRNRGAGSMEEGGWSQPVGRTRQQPYSVETAKLKSKPPSIDDTQLGSRSNYMWKNTPKITTNKFSYLENVSSDLDKRVPPIHLSGSRSTGPRDYGRLEYKTSYDGRTARNGSYQLSNTLYNKDTPVVETSRSQSMSLTSVTKSASQTIPAINIPRLSEEDFQKALNSFLEEYISGEEDIEVAVKKFKTIFPVSSHVSFVHEIINAVLEKPDHHRNKTSQLLAQLLSHECIILSHFKKGLDKIVEASGDLIIDIPKLWKYFAKILVHPTLNNTYPLAELRSLAKIRGDIDVVELVAELLSELLDVKGPSWVSEIWIKSELDWTNFTDDPKRIDEIIKNYKFNFLTEDNRASFKNDNSVWNVEQIQSKLSLVLKDGSFDDICSWIQTNISDITKEPKFIRALMTAILETSVEQCKDKWVLKVEIFDKLQKLIQRYVDADAYLELQCLFAVQAYISKSSHPAGLLLKIMTYLLENNVLSNEAFLTWESNKDPAEREGKSVALLTLKSFFIPLKEGDDISSGDEV